MQRWCRCHASRGESSPQRNARVAREKSDAQARACDFCAQHMEVVVQAAPPPPVAAAIIAPVVRPIVPSSGKPAVPTPPAEVRPPAPEVAMRPSRWLPVVPERSGTPVAAGQSPRTVLSASPSPCHAGGREAEAGAQAEAAHGPRGTVTAGSSRYGAGGDPDCQARSHKRCRRPCKSAGTANGREAECHAQADAPPAPVVPTKRARSVAKPTVTVPVAKPTVALAQQTAAVAKSAGAQRAAVRTPAVARRDAAGRFRVSFVVERIIAASDVSDALRQAARLGATEVLAISQRER